jgi:urease accessory protein
MMVLVTCGDDDALSFLGSLQLADSFFPSGLYTLSHGLEAFAQAGQFSADTLEALLADYLRHGVGPADGVALACAHRAVAVGDLDLAARADARLTAVKLPREARETSLRTGRQLLALAAQVFGGDALGPYAARVHRGVAPGNHAVALGLAMATLGIPRERAVAGELYAFAASCVGASVRLAAIDHRVAQLVLHRLKPVIAEAARAARDKGVRDIAGCVPLVDVMAMRHERAEVRLFMS